jgi:hypothetical protein
MSYHRAPCTSVLVYRYYTPNSYYLGAFRTKLFNQSSISASFHLIVLDQTIPDGSQRVSLPL